MTQYEAVVDVVVKLRIKVSGSVNLAYKEIWEDAEQEAVDIVSDQFHPEWIEPYVEESRSISEEITGEFDPREDDDEYRHRD